MGMFAIYCVSLINLITAIYLAKTLSRKRMFLTLCFVGIWSLHYVVGNALVLLSRDVTYTLAPFEQFAPEYLISLILGQYFIWAYIVLDGVMYPESGLRYRPLPRATKHYVYLAVMVTVPLALLFVRIVGVGSFFSSELAAYRSYLGEYTFEGIGYFYYLASFLLPATTIAGAYAITYPSFRSVGITILALVVSMVVFIPLGGRGRVLNIAIVWILYYLLSGNKLRLSDILTVKIVSMIVAIVAVGFLWAVLREGGDERSAFDTQQILRGLSVDTTRLPYQAFIFQRYAAVGTYFGSHYLESVLGPFAPRLISNEVGLLRELSSRWYAETVGVYNLRSAISPSFLGEIYINFGVIGLIFAPFVFHIVIRLFTAMGRVDSALAASTVIYYGLFVLFNGGMYSMFDLLLHVGPIFLFSRIGTRRPGPVLQ